MNKIKQKKICFDLDGTLCTTTKDGNYHLAEPIINAINKVNKLYSDGNYIIIFTARYMGISKGKVSHAYELGFEQTKQQLKSWGLKYNELIFGKPEYDIVYDDKSFNYSDNWINL